MQDLLSGDVDNSMTAAEVYMLWPEYLLHKYSNFVANLRNLQAALQNAKEAAARSEAAL